MSYQVHTGYFGGIQANSIIEGIFQVFKTAARGQQRPQEVGRNPQYRRSHGVTIRPTVKSGTYIWVNHIGQ